MSGNALRYVASVLLAPCGPLTIVLFCGSCRIASLEKSVSRMLGLCFVQASSTMRRAMVLF